VHAAEGAAGLGWVLRWTLNFSCCKDVDYFGTCNKKYIKESLIKFCIYKIDVLSLRPVNFKSYVLWPERKKAMDLQ
jgi:hypothetical protein